MEKEILEKYVKESHSINEVLSKMGRNSSSGGYKSFKRHISKYNIDISHFWRSRDFIRNQFKLGKLKRIDDDMVFRENSIISRAVVKRRIITQKLIEYKCCFCNNDGQWMGKKISLILDHINGINNDNRLENLRFVCPNCESALETHCKGKKGYELAEKKKVHGVRKKRKYLPRIHTRKVERPSIELLKEQVKDLGYTKTGRIYNVSDNTIRKWIKWASNQS